MKEILDTFINNVKNNIPGFLAVSVADVNSGEAYESFTADTSFDSNLASAYNLEVIKALLNKYKLALNEAL